MAWSVVVALQLFFCYYLEYPRAIIVWLSLTCRGSVAEAARVLPSPRPTFTPTGSSHGPELATFFLVVKPTVCVLLLYRGAVAARQDPDRGARSKEAIFRRGSGPAVRDRCPWVRRTTSWKGIRILQRRRRDHYPGRAGSLSWCHRARAFVPRGRVIAEDRRRRAAQPPGLRHALLGIAAASSSLHEEVFKT